MTEARLLQAQSGLLSRLWTQTDGRPSTDTYTATASGTSQNSVPKSVRSFTLAVTQTGTVTAWTVVLEVSLDGTSFTTVLTHTEATGSGIALSTGATLWPCQFWRTRCSALTLGAGTSVTARALAAT